MRIESQFGWQRALVLENECLEVIATLDVGPRILSFRKPGGENILGIVEEQLGDSGESDFRLRGGHRLWLAPEKAATYFPDNHGVQMSKLGDRHVALTAAPEPLVQKSVELELLGSELNLTHHITALSDIETPIAAWALTIFRKGGTAVIPQPQTQEHPGHADEANEAAYLPDRQLSLWSYTDVRDERINWSNPVSIEQRPDTPPLKLGFLHHEGVVHYDFGADRFTKTVAVTEDGLYPDGNCNLEVYTDGDILELETLSPLRTLKAGETLSHREIWTITEKR